MTIVTGAFQGTWGAYDPAATYAGNGYERYALGNTSTGFRTSSTYSGRTINFDSLGDAPADVIFTGVSQTVDFVLQEYDSSAVNMLRWISYTGTTPDAYVGGPRNDYNALGITRTAGGSLWDRARPLVLEPCDQIAPCNAPGRIVFPKTILDPGFTVDLNYSHIERTVALRLIVLPVAYASPAEACGWVDNPSRPIGCADLLYHFEEPCPASVIDCSA